MFIEVTYFITVMHNYNILKLVIRVGEYPWLIGHHELTRVTCCLIGYHVILDNFTYYFFYS